MNDEIAIVSVSKRVSIREVEAIADACSRQMAEHVCPAWGVEFRPVNVYDNPTKLPIDQTDIVTLQDEPGMPGALGFHSIALTPFARIFVAPVLDDGGGVVLGDRFDPQRPSLAAVFSHEIAEMTVDPWCDQYALDDQGRAVDLEVSDPVQAQQYFVKARMAWGEEDVALSDFALPAWFKIGEPGPYNWMHVHPGFGLDAPFQIAPGGYAVVDGSPTFARRATGRSVYPPAWYLAMRQPGARHMRRGPVPRRLWAPTG